MRKTLLSALAVIMVLSTAIGGSIAYLTDSESTVNVMTLGNVKIELHEMERDPDGALRGYTDGKPLLPVVGSATGAENVDFSQIGEKAAGEQEVSTGIANVQDKFVLTENTGKSDAYIRNIFAFELGSITTDAWKDLIKIVKNDLNDQNNPGNWSWTNIGEINVKGNRYYMMEAVYQGSADRHVGGVVPAGDYTFNSLAQVYMASAGTNEDCSAIDGNGNGTYDILVFAEAGQATGFTGGAEAALDQMFYDVTREQHPWLEAPYLVFTESELRSYKDGGAKKSGIIELMNDVAVSPYVGFEGPAFELEEGTVELRLNSFTLSSKRTNTVAYVGKNGHLTIKDNGVIESTSATDSSLLVSGYDSTLVIENGTFIANTNKGSGSRGTMISVSSNWGPGGNVPKIGGKLYIYDGTFIQNGEGYIILHGNGYEQGNIQVFGGKFNKTINKDYIADGYEMVEQVDADGMTWYVVVPKGSASNP